MPDVRLAHEGSRSGFGALAPDKTSLALLWSVVVIRTVVALGFATFLPVLMTSRGLSVSEAGVAVSCYLVAGSLGGLAGGPIADRFGPRRVIAASLALAAPLLAGGVVRRRPGVVRRATAGGFFLGLTLPVNITYAHMLAPVAAGTVSSLMMGVAWGIGGMAVPLVGLGGEAIGLGPTLQALALLPPSARPSPWPCPSTARRRRCERRRRTREP